MAKPKILVFDIETIPNKGYFFDRFSDRGIPLQFITESKAICTIAYKWMGSDEASVLMAETPYNDSVILTDFMKVWNESDYVIGHFADGFDIPFLGGRLLANGLEPLAPVPSLDTYKLAKKHFGKTLNSNKLDHLGTILGVGNKNTTDATLWVRCAEGDAAALEEMADYNIEDVFLLERIAEVMLPHTASKLNMRLFSEEAEIICTNCGSHKVQKRGTIVTKLSKKQRLQCQDCGAWSTTKYEN